MYAIMAQNMKVHMSSSDHYQVVPGDDPNEYSNVYIPSDSASCSSLDENEHNHDVEGEMTYPQDLLGVSWGSYLYSGPPTRGGHGPQNSFKRNVLQDGTTLNPTSISDQSTDVVPMDPLAATNVHGILRAPQAKDVTAQSKQTHQTKTVKIMHEEPPERVDSQLLFTKLQSLIKSLSDCELELEKCGLETVPVENSVFSGLKLKEFLKHIQDSKDDKSIISGRVMLDVIEYLQDIAERLMRQGKKLNEQALFLQRTGRQLGRNHQNLLEEQAMLELVTERTQGQLEKEKVQGIYSHL